jgi:hypothetical protein
MLRDVFRWYWGVHQNWGINNSFWASYCSWNMTMSLFMMPSCRTGFKCTYRNQINLCWRMLGKQFFFFDDDVLACHDWLRGMDEQWVNFEPLIKNNLKLSFKCTCLSQQGLSCAFPYPDDWNMCVVMSLECKFNWICLNIFLAFVQIDSLALITIILVLFFLIVQCSYIYYFNAWVFKLVEFGFCAILCIMDFKF